MKIKRVILPLNNNPNYTEYWNVFAPIWKNKFDIIPTMMFVGTKEELNSNNFNTTIGDIIQLDPVQEVSETWPDWSVTWSIIYGASLFPDDVCITHGIDQIPLSTFFFDYIRDFDDSKFIVGFGDAYAGYGPATLGYFNIVTNVMYPSSHLVGLGSTFNKVYDINKSWKNEIIKIYNLKNRYLLKNNFYRNSSWGLDECYSSEKISQYNSDDVIILNIFKKYWNPRRIDRGGQNLDFDCDLIKNGYYSELHSFRPYSKHKFIVDQILECL